MIAKIRSKLVQKQFTVKKTKIREIIIFILDIALDIYERFKYRHLWR
jgi:hypothetical protein